MTSDDDAKVVSKNERDAVRSLLNPAIEGEADVKDLACVLQTMCTSIHPLLDTCDSIEQRATAAEAEAKEAKSLLAECWAIFSADEMGRIESGKSGPIRDPDLMKRISVFFRGGRLTIADGKLCMESKLEAEVERLKGELAAERRLRDAAVAVLKRIWVRDNAWKIFNRTESVESMSNAFCREHNLDQATFEELGIGEGT